jgi:hypothetical protein
MEGQWATIPGSEIDGVGEQKKTKDERRHQFLFSADDMMAETGQKRSKSIGHS